MPLLSTLLERNNAIPLGDKATPPAPRKVSSLFCLVVVTAVYAPRAVSLSVIVAGSPLPGLLPKVAPCVFGTREETVLLDGTLETFPAISDRVESLS